MVLPGGGHGRDVCLLLLAFPFPAGWGFLIMSAPCLVPPFVPSSALPTTFSLSVVSPFIISAHVFLGEAKHSHSSHKHPRTVISTLSHPPFLSFIQVLFFLSCLNFSPPFLLFWPVHPSPHLLLALVCPNLLHPPRFPGREWHHMIH